MATRSAINSNCNFSSDPFWTQKLKTKQIQTLYPTYFTCCALLVLVPIQSQPQPVWLSSYPLSVSVSICSNCKFNCLCEVLCIQRQSKEPRNCHCHILSVFLYWCQKRALHGEWGWHSLYNHNAYHDVINNHKAGRMHPISMEETWMTP